MVKHRTVIADPPWDYKGGLWQRQKSKATSHYPVLSIDDIMNMPIQPFIADDAYLFLWITSRHIIKGFGQKVAEVWGFRPLTTMVWCKSSIGLGYYVRNSHEHIVFGVRGSPGQFKRRNALSWFVTQRTKHSKKPQQFDLLLESLVDGPYLNLFARDQRQGWTNWGNEVGDPLNIGFDPKGWK